jgi:hypothetical protein
LDYGFEQKVTEIITKIDNQQSSAEELYNYVKDYLSKHRYVDQSVPPTYHLDVDLTYSCGEENVGEHYHYVVFRNSKMKAGNYSDSNTGCCGYAKTPEDAIKEALDRWRLWDKK